MPTGISELEEKVRNNDKITIFTSAEIEKISGQPGIFEISIKQSDAAFIRLIFIAIIFTSIIYFLLFL